MTLIHIVFIGPFLSVSRRWVTNWCKARLLGQRQVGCLLLGSPWKFNKFNDAQLSMLSSNSITNQTNLTNLQIENDWNMEAVRLRPRPKVSAFSAVISANKHLASLSFHPRKLKYWEPAWTTMENHSRLPWSISFAIPLGLPNVPWFKQTWQNSISLTSQYLPGRPWCDVEMIRAPCYSSYVSHVETGVTWHSLSFFPDILSRLMF